LHHERPVQEVENNFSINSPVEVVTPVMSLSLPGIQAVTQVVTQAVTPVVTPEIDWQSYPYQSQDTLTLKSCIFFIFFLVALWLPNQFFLSLFARLIYQVFTIALSQFL
jgi:hypothetical protein